MDERVRGEGCQNEIEKTREERRAAVRVVVVVVVDTSEARVDQVTTPRHAMQDAMQCTA
jgi:hypothetical protein